MIKRKMVLWVMVAMFLCALSPAVARADSGPIYFSAGVLVPTTSNDIRMTREVLTVELLREEPQLVDRDNLADLAPGALSEVGVAGDRMGETPEGKAREFVPDSPKVLHVMGLIDPGVTGTLWFMAPTKPATYPIVCTYPGHWRMMNVTKPAE